MDPEDYPRRKPDDLLIQLGRQDLDPLSVSDLEERIALLTQEVDRTRAKMAFAVNHRASAEALFRK